MPLLLAITLLSGAPALVDDHVDARDYPSPGAGRAAFEKVERALVRGFDGICGDTFCEGEYSNLRALQLRCAVRRRDGVVTACAWSFAGSHAQVGSDDAVPVVQASTYACALPLGQGVALDWMHQNLTGSEALDTVFPVSGRSSYDALADCL